MKSAFPGGLSANKARHGGTKSGNAALREPGRGSLSLAFFFLFVFFPGLLRAACFLTGFTAVRAASFDEAASSCAFGGRLLCQTRLPPAICSMVRPVATES